MFNRPNPDKFVEKVQRESKERDEACRKTFNPTQEEKAKQREEETNKMAEFSAKLEASKREPTREEVSDLNRKAKEVGLSQEETIRAGVQFIKELKKPAETVRSNSIFQPEKDREIPDSSSEKQENCCIS